MFTVTPAAAEQIARAAREQPESRGQPMLRVAAKYDGSDGELVFGMGFDDEREGDLIVNSAGVGILISPLSQPLLQETTLDFTEIHPGEFQFIFRGGGCGSACS
jgi:iron-sulfur cluster assembly protein